MRVDWYLYNMFPRAAWVWNRLLEKLIIADTMDQKGDVSLQKPIHKSRDIEGLYYLCPMWSEVPQRAALPQNCVEGMKKWAI